MSDPSGILAIRDALAKERIRLVAVQIPERDWQRTLEVLRGELDTAPLTGSRRVLLHGIELLLEPCSRRSSTAGASVTRYPGRDPKARGALILHVERA